MNEADKKLIKAILGHKKKILLIMFCVFVYYIASNPAFISFLPKIGHLLLAVMFFGFLLGAYFLPFIFSLVNGHKDQTAILVINTFLGWTILGWIIALTWAVKKP